MNRIKLSRVLTIVACYISCYQCDNSFNNRYNELVNSGSQSLKKSIDRELPKESKFFDMNDFDCEYQSQWEKWKKFKLIRNESMTNINCEVVVQTAGGKYRQVECCECTSIWLIVCSRESSVNWELSFVSWESSNIIGAFKWLKVNFSPLFSLCGKASRGFELKIKDFMHEKLMKINSVVNFVEFSSG